MRKMRLSLLNQLERLETEQYQNAVAIIEVHRRLHTLAQVKSWSLPLLFEGNTILQVSP